MAETQEVKRGPGRPPSVAKKPAPRTVDVTYAPQHGDPVSTVWHGHTFHANKPTPVPEGHPLLKQATSNPWFTVAGQDAPVQVSADQAVPTTSEEYRAYAIAWFKTVESSAEMKARWASEEGLRVSCGVGTDDLEYLNKLYVPRLAELEKAEG